MKQIYLILFLNFSALTFCQAQPNDLPPNTDPGKCYAKCFIPDIYEIYEEEYPIYIGEHPETVDLDTIELLVYPTGQKWELQSRDDCRSAFEEDCLVWTSINTPDEYRTIVYMTNPSQSDEVDWEVLEVQELSEVNSITEWREVLCAPKCDERLISKLQKALKEEKFYLGEIDSILNLETKAALIKYQKMKQLPVGQLDIETLKKLDVIW